MGTTASYVLLSKLPEFNKKISLVISLAPIAFWKESLPRLMRFGVNRLDALKVSIFYIFFNTF